MGEFLISWYGKHSKASESTKMRIENVGTSIDMVMSSSRHKETGSPETDVNAYGRPVVSSRAAFVLWSFSIIDVSSDGDK